MFNVIYSIRKPYSRLIESGEKILEFRNQIGNGLGCGSKMYVYETKRNGGAGAVIGYAKVKNIIEINYSYFGLGTMFLLPYFVKLYGTAEEKECVEYGMPKTFLNRNFSIYRNYILSKKFVDEVYEAGSIASICNKFSGEEINEIEEKTYALIKKCDEWGKKIGFYDEYDEVSWKYAIELDQFVKFGKPKPVEDFVGMNGEPIKRAPQSWCYAWMKENVSKLSDRDILNAIHNFRR